MDRLDAMAALIAAVDGGSLSAASRALGMPLPTVSRKISELEAHLRTQLLVRTSRKLVLTEAGLAYVAASRRILDEIEDAERTASGEYRAPRGHLTITAPVVFGRLHVEPVVLDFLKAYPDIDARLVLADQFVNLVDQQVDVAIRIGVLPDSSMIATRIGQVGWVTCASPHYLEMRGTPETPAALDQHDCIMFEGVYSNNLWNFGRGKKATVLPVRPRFAVNTADAAIAAALASAGITHVLSYQVAGAIASGALRLILRPHEPELLPVHIVYAAQTLMPLKLRAFLDFAAPRLKASVPDFGGRGH
ncbi:LysR family transcriptional regulator [Bradyrhizobium guangdongense]|uniref:LysR family transcriptional regulator n=1 Tax=Bradyrhizobium guangdongense TaxID=1325090 RepID=UPI00112E4A25|nr:LysR family transcriptional regulator [Bradyrhizobium guangdongense]TPQ41172.1 LysR family transcriptional regulator [Bradyrhizobium guangdongense]